MTSQELMEKARELREHAQRAEQQAHALQQAQSLRSQAAQLTAQADQLEASYSPAPAAPTTQSNSQPAPVMSFEEHVNRAAYGPNYDAWKAGQDAMSGWQSNSTEQGQ